MMTSQTRNIVKKTYHDTAWRVGYYKKRAKEQWRWHRRIRGCLLLDIIDVGVLEGLIAAEHYYYTCDSGSVCRTLEAVGFVVFIILTLILLLDFFLFDHTRKAEIFEIGNMECRLVKVELKELLDEIENLRGDEVLRKHGELARRVTEVTKWVEANTA